MKICPHWFKPIVSIYGSFNTRDIISECCICNRRIEERVWKPFSTPFPIPTDSVDWKDFKLILSGSPYERLGSIVYVKDEHKVKKL